MPGERLVLRWDLLVTIEDIKVSPAPTARNIGVVLDDQLSCNANITTPEEDIVPQLHPVSWLTWFDTTVGV